MAVDLIKRHPIPGGVVVAAVGLWMLEAAHIEGLALQRFVDAQPIQAVVMRTYNAVDRPVVPDYKADIRWLDVTGATRHATIDVYRDHVRRLHPGDSILVVVSRQDPSSAMLESTYRNAGSVRVLGHHLSGIGVVGILLILAGLGLSGWGALRNIAIGSPSLPD